MKLFFSKLSSLLTVLVGIALIGQFIKCPYICAYIAKLYDGTLDVFPGSTLLAGAIIFILIGGYSLLPTFSSKKIKYKILKQNFDSGYAEINLASLEKECAVMLKRVSPINQVSVKLFPEKENKLRAEISPVVILDDEQNLPKIEQTITSRLQEFLSNYFGIELLKPVVLKIDEFQMEGEKIYHLLDKEKTSEEQEIPTPSETVPSSPEELQKEDLSQIQGEPLQCKPDTSTDIKENITEDSSDTLKCRFNIESSPTPSELSSQNNISDILTSTELPEDKDNKNYSNENPEEHTL